MEESLNHDQLLELKMQTSAAFLGKEDSLQYDQSYNNAKLFNRYSKKIYNSRL